MGEKRELLSLILKHKKKIIGAILALLMGGSITISMDGIRVDTTPIADKHGILPPVDNSGQQWPGIKRF
jgi:hypothetical protein